MNNNANQQASQSQGEHQNQSALPNDLAHFGFSKVR
jgi:hypothetical protein